MGGDNEAFKAAIAKILPFAMKAKTQMLAAKVPHARKTCPECGGTVHFAIGGIGGIGLPARWKAAILALIQKEKDDDPTF